MMEGWIINKLLNVCHVYQPQTISQKQLISDGEYFVYGANGIIGKYDKYNHEEPEVLLTCRGATCGSINLSKPKSWINGNAMVVKPIDLSIDKLFLKFLLMGAVDFKSIISGAAQPQITRQSLNSLDILYPKSLSEQRKIAYVLRTVEKAIEQQDKLIRTTTELKKALMQKLFTEGIKGEKLKQTEIGWVPESWEEITIGDLGKCVTGTTPKTAVEEYWNSNDFDFITPADVGVTKYVYNSEKKMSLEGLKVSRILPKNTVLCVCIGSSIGKVGLTFKEQSATNQQINSIICNEDFNPIYVYYLLFQYAEYWRGHATFGPVPILNKGQFELIKIFVTKDKKEQELIAESLSAFDRKIEYYEKKKQTLTDLFKTLLHELMTGQRRVHEIDFENECHKVRNKKEEMLLAAEPNIKYKK